LPSTGNIVAPGARQRSWLAIGAAAGAALTGTARGTYTFGAHLKWTPVIRLGYAASIVCHLWLNAHPI